jgi:hypothetical protein
VPALRPRRPEPGPRGGRSHHLDRPGGKLIDASADPHAGRMWRRGPRNSV